MTVDLTAYEAEILIAVLTGAEGAFAIANPPLVEAMGELRAFRSALLQSYLRERLAQPVTAGAVDPNDGRTPA